MRKYLAALAVAASTFSVMATDARVETMGGHHHFFKDDQSIFTNPATIADYGKMLTGSFGIYTAEEGEDNQNKQYNRDARKPYFGGTMSWGGTEEKKSKFTVGTVLNRYDPMLRYINPKDKELYIGKPEESLGDSVTFIDSLVGKIDIIAGYTLNNGMTIGLGTYMAFQSEKEDNVDKAETRLTKGTLGISGPVSDNIELDASIGISAYTLKGYNELDETVTSADNDIAISIDVRAFSSMPRINGSFVPHIQANIIKHHKDETLLDFNGGIGFNSNIDRGFFWGAFEGVYQNDSKARYSAYKKITGVDTDNPDAPDNAYNSAMGKRSRIGGRASFGIERNVLTDWLVWRVGGSKLLAYEKLDDGNIASYWVENSGDDHVSFGMGVNIEDRFKVDAIVSENLLYTFSNLFSGNSHHFSSKISATFSF